MSIGAFFKDKNDKIVVFQWPNWSLWLAIGFAVGGYFFSGIVGLICEWGLRVSLIYWSYLEIFFGVNAWRKVLGVIVGGYNGWLLLMMLIG